MLQRWNVRNSNHSYKAGEREIMLAWLVLRALGLGWDGDDELGAFTYFTVALDGAAEPLGHQVVSDVEPESGLRHLTAGREERLKYSRKVGSRDAAPIVAHHDMGALRSALDRERDHALVMAVVSVSMGRGIEHEVFDHFGQGDWLEVELCFVGIGGDFYSVGAIFEALS